MIMTKKVIIYVFIFLIVINTIYWISLINLLGSFDNKTWEIYKYKSSKSVLKMWNLSFLSGLYRYSGEHGDYAVKNIISLLTITDAVLIAISFMIILLYKKE